jgi:hypothetical protein
VTLGVEVISYGTSGGRQVASAWAALQEYSDQFRERHPDLRRFGVRLHCRSHRMPPPRAFEPFCEAVAAQLRRNTDLPARGKWRTVHIDPTEPVVGKYLSRIEVYGVTFYSQWEWPASISGGIGTSDEELHAVIERKLRSYRAPAGIDETHLVIFGRGPELTCIAAPFSAEIPATYSDLNTALSKGPFAAAAILAYATSTGQKPMGGGSFPRARALRTYAVKARLTRCAEHRPCMPAVNGALHRGCSERGGDVVSLDRQ